MKRNWINGLGGALVIFSLAGAGSAFAQEEGFTEWDADGDGGIGYEEWDTGYEDEGLFDTWDGNDDGYVDETEYGEGVFGLYDEDDDGIWSEEEYNYFQDDAGDEGFWDV